MDEGPCSFERLGKHTDAVMCVSVFVGSDGTNRIVSGSDDKTLKVWNAESGVCERTLQGHTDWVTCVAVFMDSDGFPRFVIGSGKSVKMLNCKDLTLIADLRRRIRELEEIIEELKSLPGGYYYLEAK
ncbi:MAG TPA: hypothetical protein VIH30_11115, partial [Aquirhabdus sp.]